MWYLTRNKRDSPSRSRSLKITTISISSTRGNSPATLSLSHLVCMSLLHGQARNFNFFRGWRVQQFLSAHNSVHIYIRKKSNTIFELLEALNRFLFNSYYVYYILIVNFSLVVSLMNYSLIFNMEKLSGITSAIIFSLFLLISSLGSIYLNSIFMGLFRYSMNLSIAFLDIHFKRRMFIHIYTKMYHGNIKINLQWAESSHILLPIVWPLPLWPYTYSSTSLISKSS